MLVLFETPAGFAIFKVLNEKKLKNIDNLYEHFETAEKASKVLQLQDFKKFFDCAEAVQAGVALNEGKLCKPLKKLLKKNLIDDVQEQLLVWDPKLGSSIKEKFSVSVSSSGVVGELMRCIKSQVEGLIPGLEQKEMTAMSLGLAHNLARYKLKFSPDKVDTMIVQAVSLLDDIDKELNNYIMRVKEWYGWHFPELTKVITDNIVYMKIILAMGKRENASVTDFSSLLSEEEEAKVKDAAEFSMGTELTDEDMLNVTHLCQQVSDLMEYRTELYEYLQNRMQAIAPNLAIMVGELVGARLIAHAGSLINLAKHPASTIQIIGAEKALFRALKSRSTTPKYGLIYHAHMVGQASAKNKGKMSRMLAAKTALAVRYDALGEETNTEMGINNMTKLSIKFKMIEEGMLRKISGNAKSQFKNEKYHKSSEVKHYHSAADSTMESSSKRKMDQSYETPKAKKVKIDPNATKVIEVTDVAGPEQKKKKNKQKEETEVELKEEPIVESPKKKKKKSLGIESEITSVEIMPNESSKKKKKKALIEVGVEEIVVTPEKKKKKKKSMEVNEEEEEVVETPILGKKKKYKQEEQVEEVSVSAKKKKKKKSPAEGED